MSGGRFLIWSLEHKLWWKADGWGYTDKYSEAGRYSLQEAFDICQRSNIHTFRRGVPPNEAIVPEEGVATDFDFIVNAIKSVRLRRKV